VVSTITVVIAVLLIYYVLDKMQIFLGFFLQKSQNFLKMVVFDIVLAWKGLKFVPLFYQIFVF